MDDYYDILVDNGFDNLDEMVRKMKGSTPITTSELEHIGVRKAGHRYKILLKLESDA